MTALPYFCGPANMKTQRRPFFTTSRIKVILFNLALLIVLLWGVEMLLWRLFPNYQYYYRTHPAQPDLEAVLAKSDTAWLRPHDEFGWVCQQKSSLPFPSPPIDGIHYQINQEGFRNAFNFADSNSMHKKRILLLGDSFMFGIYLEEEETITARLQKAKGADYQFYNIAVPAWGLDQMYLAYREYVSQIQPDQVILAFVDDDLMRSLEILYHGCGPKPCLKIEDGRLVPNHDNPHWWEYLCWNNQIGNRFLRMHYQRKARRLARFMLTDIIKRELTQGRQLALVRIPAWVDLEAKVSRKRFSMSDLAMEYQLPYLELYDTLAALPPATYSEYYLPDDGHFSAAGASMLADYLDDWIE